MCCRGDSANLAILRDVISHDHNIIGMDATVIITPEANKVSNIVPYARIIDDKLLLEKYPILASMRGQLRGWYYQQMLKWCSIDMLRVERIMIQDSDTFMQIPYQPFKEGKLNFMTRPLRKEAANGWGRAETYAALMHRYPVVNHHCITEFCPYTYTVWESLKDRITSIHGKHWLEAVFSIIDSRWNDFEGFFEYHIMVNHAVHERFDHDFFPATVAELWYPGDQSDMIGFDRIVYQPTIDKDGNELVNL